MLTTMLLVAGIDEDCFRAVAVDVRATFPSTDVVRTKGADNTRDGTSGYVLIQIEYAR